MNFRLYSPRGLPSRRGVRDVTGHVGAAVSRFRAFAREYGVSRQTTTAVARVLDRQLAALAS